jgi:hypothetical protein
VKIRIILEGTVGEWTRRIGRIFGWSAPGFEHQYHKVRRDKQSPHEFIVDYGGNFTLDDCGRRMDFNLLLIVGLMVVVSDKMQILRQNPKVACSPLLG